MKKIRKGNLILFLGCAAFIVVGAVALLATSFYYQEMYGTPRIKSGVVDFTDMSKDDLLRVGSTNLTGDWEFFYNKWIVTDGYDGAPDGMIRLPSRWTGKTVNGRRLPKTGYASYRLTVKNCPAEWLFVECSYISHVAYRVFINDTLCVESGTMSKERSTAFATGAADEKILYTPVLGENILVVVIEISDNAEGGLMSYPWLNVRMPLRIHEWLDYTLPYIIIGGILVAILFCFLLPVRVLKQDNMLTLALFLLALFLHYLVGVDLFDTVFDALNLSTAYVPPARYLTGVLFAASNIVNLVYSKIITLSRTEKKVLAAVNVVAIIAIIPLSGSYFQLIPLSVFLLCILYILFKIVMGKQKLGFTCANALIHTFLFCVLCLEVMDGEGIIVYTSKVMFSIGVFLFLLAVIFINFYRIRESQKALIAAARLETEIAIMKNQTLKAQIKPHFVFNSLSAIQAVYRRDPAEGEEMLSRFSEHLRANVDSDNRDVVPFEDELNHMLNYFELENLRSEKKLSLILNVEYTDFTVPALSLEPFLENAIRHADTQNIAGGQIQISAILSEGGAVVVEVADNGKGFDFKSVRKDAVGMKNAIERLKYSLGAVVTVNSEIGKGATITITIPKAKREVKQ